MPQKRNPARTPRKYPKGKKPKGLAETSSVVTSLEQNKNKRQEQHFSSVVTSIVTCSGQRQQPRTYPRIDQFHLVNKCIISTKQ
jgi:hypothetical protein